MNTLNTATLTSAAKSLYNAKSVFNLFESIGYKEYLLDESYVRNKSEFDFNKDILSNIKNIYTISNIDKYLYCFLIEANKISKTFLRNISKRLVDAYIRVLIISTDDWQNIYFTLPQYEKKEGERKLKLSTLHLDINQIYRTDLETISNLQIQKELSYRDIWRNWQNAFSKERVNEEFYQDFQEVFFDLRQYVHKQCDDIKISHEFTQQTLNRMMFIYFIAKKGWLNSDPIFLSSFYQEYKKERNRGNTPPNSFYENWLSILFFEVFNKSYPNMGIARYFSNELKNQLIHFPYLNGGLFKKEEFDRNNITISDDKFDKIFSFLNKYNFTIKEDLPLEVEVAVDPQMLGYLYESFANIAEEIYERNDLGIFYTSTTEVDFMVRRSLAEYLLAHLSKNKVPHDIIYRLVFDDDKNEAFKYFNNHKLWYEVSFLLSDIRVVDPACGSGAFLLGYLKILVELTRIADSFLEYSRSDFDLKKEIIGKNLYGVDIMKWALHCAELRLWLSMIVEEDLPLERRKEPLLPNFDLRLRVGDSLVQKIGNINFNLDDFSIPVATRRKLEYLGKEKDKFYSNDPAKKFKTLEDIQGEENRIFCEILASEEIKIGQEIQKLTIELSEQKQLNMYGETKKDESVKNKREQIVREIEELRGQRNNIINISRELKVKGKQFIIWEIDFVDVFHDKKGFDVVIGNPPYIRQENISPPFVPRGEVTKEEKREYKEALIGNILIKYPFLKHIDRQSDYYIYFYLKGLSLLNPEGTFCFITSNSWLDVGYGRVLQEFLIKYTPIKAIYDNQAKRSFAHASINTIIALFGSPKFLDKRNPTATCLNNVAKFIMFKKPFEEVISYKNMVTIHNFFPEPQNLFGNIYKSEDFRIYAITQKELLLEGLEQKEGKVVTFKEQITGSYRGSKWGGKYLRAPDIFFTILEKGKDKLVRLGDIAEVRRGFTTGANDFFYVEDVTDKIDFMKVKAKIQNLREINSLEHIAKKQLRIIYNKPSDTYWLIEMEFLNPIIKSPRECKSIIMIIEDLKYKVFMCRKSKKELTETKAIDYILWGEKQNYHKRPTCASRKIWYYLGYREPAPLLVPEKIGEKFVACLNLPSLLENKLLYGVIPLTKIDHNELISYINSSVCRLFIEIFSRQLTGAQAIADVDVGDWENILVVKPNKAKVENYFGNRIINSIFKEYRFDKNKPIREQQPNPLPDRKALDDVIFNVLGLTEEERKKVYWATAELVKNRLDKARSLKK